MLAMGIIEMFWCSNVADYRTGSVPPARRHHNHAPLPQRLVPHVRQGVQRTSVECQWHRQHTDEAHNVNVAAIQEYKVTAQSRSPNIQNYTLVR